jgi:hypothetical protein
MGVDHCGSYNLLSGARQVKLGPEGGREGLLAGDGGGLS